MPRPVKKRDTYQRDIATLNRIAAAVRLDERLSERERELCVAELHAVIKRLMKVELAGVRDGQEEAS
jgi:hypothetical protein